ncbi:MAG: hypothetical protein AVDCRST_MAG96-889 [uncultured Segetibacter sp.]|uniref:Uncharacterized protein n=1 Tax=uncultured Segetibacter sp. TaxID=481133 RepID=A0A6J4RQQ9_9BACT|nr:MAG: hypothetical protein AVDCRST_MAG96-889 [uncultured Segetibacter sp.]
MFELNKHLIEQHSFSAPERSTFETENNHRFKINPTPFKHISKLFKYSFTC